MNKRSAAITRKTGETEITLKLTLDGEGDFTGATGLGFFDHMLELFCRHAAVDVELRASGDLHVDEHHLVEDLGIALGTALKSALGEKKGINRYGWCLIPMDEVLVAAAIDLSGRFAFQSDYRPVRERVGDLPTELVPHFFQSLAAMAGCNLHLRFLNPGSNEHHRIEAAFKGFARALRMAVAPDVGDPERIPSTKGVL